MAVKGMVQVRSGEDRPWEAVKTGMVLDQGAEFRTGPRSAVTFRIPPQQDITLDRLGTIKILQAIQEGAKIKTDLGMQYGRTRYDIEAAGLEYDASIKSPGSSLGIRGTDVIYEDQGPWVPNCASIHGKVQYKNQKKQFIAFGDKRPARIQADQSGSANTALTKTKVDPKGDFAGRTDGEDAVIQSQPSVGVSGKLLSSIADLTRGPSGFKDTFVGVPEVDGPLFFDLIWQPPAGTKGGKVGQADLNLSVTDPNGQTASFQNPKIGSGSSVGEYVVNNPGKGGAGAERVQWSFFFPSGLFHFKVDHVKGDPAQVFVLVTLKQTTEVALFGTNPKQPIILHQGQSYSGAVTVSASSGNGQGNPQKAVVARAGRRK
jgi:hypothetical protein